MNLQCGVSTTVDRYRDEPAYLYVGAFIPYDAIIFSRKIFPWRIFEAL